MFLDLGVAFKTGQIVFINKLGQSLARPGDLFHLVVKGLVLVTRVDAVVGKVVNFLAGAEGGLFNVTSLQVKRPVPSFLHPVVKLLRNGNRLVSPGVLIGDRVSLGLFNRCDKIVAIVTVFVGCFPTGTGSPGRFHGLETTPLPVQLQLCLVTVRVADGDLLAAVLAFQSIGPAPEGLFLNPFDVPIDFPLVCRHNAATWV